ncbi:hypothetical protein [Streptomyces sp. NPDC051776]|uniref:hypothetical protein n=1 Tax=Streptomyces sp. NPDC051776 TaxID=3155414 RepID=UPI00343E632C
MTTNGGPSSTSRGASRFQRAALPTGPQSADAYPDRATLLRQRKDALDALVDEDLSRARGLAFLVCQAAMVICAFVVPVVLINAITAATADATSIATAAAFTVVVLAVFGVLPVLVLRSAHERAVQRWQLIRDWFKVDRSAPARALPPGAIAEGLALAHDRQQAGMPASSPAGSHEFPNRYGSRGYPHSRFFNAAVLVIIAAIAIPIIVFGDDSAEPNKVGWVLSLLMAAVLAWSVIVKYRTRYRWAAAEQVIRSKERRRWQQRTQLSAGQSPSTVAQGLHPAGLYALLLSPTLVVALIYVTARPRIAGGFVVIASIALAIGFLGVPVVFVRWQGERRAMREAAERLASAFDGAPAVRPVRYGLNQDGQSLGSADSWDQGPSRTGAVVLTGGTLKLRGVDGSDLQLPLSDLVGAAFIPSGVAWLTGSVDLFLESGQAIEMRTPQPRNFLEELAQTGVRVLG